MVIDAHAHACGKLNTINGIMAYMQRNSLDKIVLCPGEQSSNKNYPVPMVANLFSSAKIGYGFNQIIRKVVRASRVSDTLHRQNQAIASMVKAYPNQILQAYWINPLEENSLERMDAFYQHNSFCMVKIHQCWHNFSLDHKNMGHILDWAQAYRLPIFIHILSSHESHIFCSVANAYPDCLFIVGHMIGFDCIAPNLKHGNVFFDISAPFMIPFRHLQAAVKLWGGSRLILGSDTPYGNENITKNKLRIEKLEISPAEKRCILGENFEYLLSLHH